MEKEKDDLKIYSEEVRDVLSEPPRKLYRWGNTMLLGFILILLSLSYIIRYPDIITAPITITTQMPPEKIVARSTGTIVEIFVEDRALVKKDTPLALIENTAKYKDVFELKNILDTLRVNTENFVFPLDKTLFLQLGDIKTALAQFEKDYLQYRLNKNLAPYKVDYTAQQSEIVQLQKRLELLNQQKKIGDQELGFKKKELDRFEKLYQKGVIPTQEWETQKLEYLQEQKDIKTLGLQISELRSSIIDLNRNSQSTQINKKIDKINFLRNALQSYNQLKKAIDQWAMSYVLRSSIAGKVSYLQVWSENQVVNTGETVFTIIPENENYLGRVMAPIQNSGKLEIGQKINIRLANYPYREYGVLQGKVESISLTPNREGLYLIDVSLPKKLITNYGKKIQFKQEMSGTAQIITEELRLIERFFYQLREIFSR